MPTSRGLSAGSSSILIRQNAYYSGRSLDPADKPRDVGVEIEQVATDPKDNKPSEGVQNLVWILNNLEKDQLRGFLTNGIQLDFQLGQTELLLDRSCNLQAQIDRIALV